jgi:proteasome lid subunit RPN8/RPN11
MTNVAASREVYLLDGQELLEVERSADRSGRSILGVMHSHTHTEAYPSATDIEEATRSDPFGIWFFTIVTLKDPEPVARAFRIVERDVIEVRVAIESG